MGQVATKIQMRIWGKKTADDYRKELKDINKGIDDLEQKKFTLRHHHNLILELIVTYSRLLYVLVALVFFFTTLPTTFIEYILFCGPLIIFYILVYVFKAAVKWYYDMEIRRNICELKTLKIKKQSILRLVKENMQYKDAVNILETYGPEKPVIDKVAVRKIMQGSPPNKTSQYLGNVVSYVLGEEKENSLICKYCNCHNGMAPEGESVYTAFRCCRCFYMNYPQKQKTLDDSDSRISTDDKDLKDSEVIEKDDLIASKEQ